MTLGDGLEGNKLLQWKFDSLMQLLEVLPKERMAKFSQKFPYVRSKRLFSLAAVSSGFLESDQRTNLLTECQKLNSELDEALRKVKKIEDEYRKKYEQLAETVFTDGQKRLLERKKRMSIDKYVETLSVQDMSTDTSLKAFEK